MKSLTFSWPNFPEKILGLSIGMCLNMGFKSAAEVLSEISSTLCSNFQVSIIYFFILLDHFYLMHATTSPTCRCISLGFTQQPRETTYCGLQNSLDELVYIFLEDQIYCRRWIQIFFSRCLFQRRFLRCHHPVPLGRLIHCWRIWMRGSRAFGETSRRWRQSWRRLEAVFRQRKNHFSERLKQGRHVIWIFWDSGAAFFFIHIVYLSNF